MHDSPPSLHCSGLNEAPPPPPNTIGTELRHVPRRIAVGRGGPPPQRHPKGGGRRLHRRPSGGSPPALFFWCVHSLLKFDGFGGIANLSIIQAPRHRKEMSAQTISNSLEVKPSQKSSFRLESRIFAQISRHSSKHSDTSTTPN